MHKERRSKLHDGMTLVELLLVIAIIAVLASLIFTGARAMSQRTSKLKCQSNLRQLGMGFQLYANDHNNLLPGQGIDYRNRWMHQIASYLAIEDTSTAYWQAIFHCPLVDKNSVGVKGPNNGSGIYGYPLSIAANNSAQGPSKLTVESPVATVLLADKNYKGGDSDGPGLAVDNPFPNSSQGAAANHRSDSKPSNGPSGQANYLYFDGHVETLNAWPGTEAFALRKTK